MRGAPVRVPSRRPGRGAPSERQRREGCGLAGRRRNTVRYQPLRPGQWTRGGPTSSPRASITDVPASGVSCLRFRLFRYPRPVCVRLYQRGALPIRRYTVYWNTAYLCSVLFLNSDRSRHPPRLCYKALRVGFRLSSTSGMECTTTVSRLGIARIELSAYADRSTSKT